MGIIEKLGVTKSPWNTLVIEGKKAVVDESDCSLLSVVYEDGTPFGVVYENTDAQLIATAPEMLEALIEISIRLELKSNSTGLYESLIRENEKNIVLIEKATNKSWEEIKEQS